MTLPSQPPPDDNRPRPQQSHNYPPAPLPPAPPIPLHPSAPVPAIQWTGKGRSPHCTGCGRPMHNTPEYPKHGTGCIVALLGLLFAPCLLGIPIIIIGLMMMNERRDRWVCLGCGRELRL